MSSSPQPGNSRDSLNFKDIPKLLRDVRFWNIAGQIIAVVLIVTAIAILGDNLLYNLQRLGLGLGFDFLDSQASFDIGESLIPYNPADTFGRAIAVGLLNSLRIIVLGLILASIVGLIVGIARLSDNWLVRHLALVYVETFRNIPLLVQLLFWYSAVLLKLPPLEKSVTLLNSIFLTQTGLYVPWFVSNATTGIWVLLLAIGIVGAAWAWRWRTRMMVEQGRPGRQLLWAAGAIAISLLLALILTRREPFVISLPQVTNDAIEGGLRMSPEFCAILIGLVFYTGSFIAEIVRAGIQSVPKGQWEAAKAVGLRGGLAMRLIILPQALRVIIPPLTSQYLNLAKNSSLAIAVGFSDIYQIASTTLNQTGRAVEVMAIIAVAYLTISLIISSVMNFLNSRVQLKER
ncbi:MAG TPA: ABC transporter permease subunit [Chroococcales cyanobacterium]|jgi:general L-amino acid transport system permease protein